MPSGGKEPNRIIGIRNTENMSTTSYSKKTARADDLIQLIGRKVIAGKNITT